jgi:putative hemolysin
MNTTPKRTGFRYPPEELETRDRKADETFADGFIDRNREAIDRDLKAARAKHTGTSNSKSKFCARRIGRKRGVTFESGPLMP